MLVLRANLDDLELVTSAAADIEVHLSAMQADGSTPPIVQPLPNLGPLASITSATTTQILDTSGITSGHNVNVKHLNIRNNHGSTSCDVDVRVNDGTNTTSLMKVTLLAGETLVLTQGGVWVHYDVNGGVYPASFNQINIQDFTASGTYTPSTGMKWCIVICTAPGGGGGGADNAAAGSGDVGVGAGGGAGETRIGFFSKSQIGASQTVTINAVGAAGTNAGGTGGTGGTAVFGSLITSNGGVGGTGSGSTTQDSQTTAGGAGGTAGSGGTIAITGGTGGRGIAGSADGTIDILLALAGDGGVSYWGGGGAQAGAVSNTLTTANNVAGANGAARGSGGSGAASTASTTGAAGGAGAGGGIMVIEFM